MTGPLHTGDFGYRETIQMAATGDRKYIRFFDGRGHFAHLRLQLLPRPGELCVVTKSDNLEIPEPCYHAARAAIFKKLEFGPIQHYPMVAVEAQIIGGTHLPKYSYPEAFALAASMVFDEAVLRAAPVVMEPWIGLTLSVETEAVCETLATLTRFVTDVPASISFKGHFVIRAHVPVRLLSHFARALRLPKLETFRLPKEQQYRLMTDPPGRGKAQGYPLDDWT